jgi:hypothetical protein
MKLEDATGSSYGAKVNANNHLATYATTESNLQVAGFNGNAYNINTGPIALTGTGDSALLYFQNDEVDDYIVTAVEVGIGTLSATITDSALITVIRNPTGGDLISDATAASIVANSNFGSANTFSATTLIYKGKDGGTITGGADHAQFYATGGLRATAELNIVIPRSSSIAIKIDLNTSGGGNVYAALIGHLRDSNLG